MAPKNEAELLLARRRIVERLRRVSGVVVAYSGGVDSSVLAALAREALGERAVAVTADSATLPPGELDAARAVVECIGIRHVVLPHDELAQPGVAENPPDRCYHCKRGLLKLLSVYAGEHGLAAVAEGTNASELGGHRPGFRAAREAGALTPLADEGLTKEDVRALARGLGLPNWDKPSMACLSSRFPYGTRLTREALDRVGRAELALRGLGFAAVRVRHHGDVARVEVPAGDLGRALERRAELVKALRDAGYAYATLDLVGYRTGSMDEVLAEAARTRHEGICRPKGDG